MANISAQAINKFFFYSMNYETDIVEFDSFGLVCRDYLPTFFRDIQWTCNTAHMVGKWKSIEETDSYGRMNRFIAELDGTNRVKLFEWIMDNYKGEPKLP